MISDAYTQAYGGVYMAQYARTILRWRTIADNYFREHGNERSGDQLCDELIEMYDKELDYSLSTEDRKNIDFGLPADWQHDEMTPEDTLRLKDETKTACNNDNDSGYLGNFSDESAPNSLAGSLARLNMGSSTSLSSDIQSNNTGSNYDSDASDDSCRTRNMAQYLAKSSTPHESDAESG